MNAWAGGRVSRMSTPRNCAFPSNSWDTCARCGASWVHGPHHEAHTFTTTGSPWSEVSRDWNCWGSNDGSAVGLVGSSADEPAEVGSGVPAPDDEQATRSAQDATAASRRRTPARVECVGMAAPLWGPRARSACGPERPRASFGGREDGWYHRRAWP